MFELNPTVYLITFTCLLSPVEQRRHSWRETGETVLETTTGVQAHSFEIGLHTTQQRRCASRGLADLSIRIVCLQIKRKTVTSDWRKHRAITISSVKYLLWCSSGDQSANLKINIYSEARKKTPDETVVIESWSRSNSICTH